MQSDKEIIEGVLAEFSEIAKYPRPSGHEKAISDYLVNRLKKLGLKPIQDKVNNVICDKPATPGYEDVPLTILQGHMDMVCVAEPGRKYDRLHDAIVLKRDGDILSADGTSLGADDGIAEAVAFYLLEQDFPHGPLRVIFTVDEETGMTGAINLDPKYVQDAKYIFNCDSESMDVLVVGSAGSLHTDFSKKIQRQVATGDTALQLTIKDLLGGHSGETINDGKSNAIKELALLLRRIEAAGVSFTIASIDGGVAANAIPSNAQAVIVLNKADVATVEKITQAAKADFDAMYGEIEKTASFAVQTATLPDKTFSAADTKALIQLLNLLHCGVMAMNQRLRELPDLSANIGTIKLAEDVLTIQYFPRASADVRLTTFSISMTVLAELTGFDVKFGTMGPSWTENPHSELAPLVVGACKDLKGKEMRVEAMHGGLETGFFFAANPNLDIVSIGATTHDIHSPQEILDLSTIPVMVRVLAETLKRMKK